MELGAENGSVKVRTGVSGAAARMGHRLVLDVPTWSAKVIFSGDDPVSVMFRASLDSIQVESGRGGVTPLTVVDKQVIRRNALKAMNVEEYPEAVFTSTSITDHGESFVIVGELTIHGETAPLQATLVREDRRLTACVPVVQSDFGVRPYSAMLGQLRVDDEVEVDLDITVPQ